MVNYGKRNWSIYFFALAQICLILLFSGCISGPNVAELEYKATRGDAAAQTALGEIAYFYGIDGKIDYVKALEYFSAAAESGNSRAIYFKGMVLASAPLPGGNYIDEGKRLQASAVPYLLEEFKLNGDPATAYLLGFSDREKMVFAESRFYYPATVALAIGGYWQNSALGGNGKDERDSEIRLRRASKWGCVEADYQLGVYYLDSDAKRSREYFARAAKKEHPAAIFALGGMKNIEKSAALGYWKAQLYLAENEQNLSEAERKMLYALAVSSGNDLAKVKYAAYLNRQGDLSHAAILGKYVEKDFDHATGLFFPTIAIWPESGEAMSSECLRNKAFPNDYERNSWYGLNDVEELKSFFVENRHYQDKVGYWLAYALAASRAGQGECARYGAKRYLDLCVGTNSIDSASRRVAGLISANARLLSGEAVEFIYKEGSGAPFSDHIDNLVRIFLPRLLSGDNENILPLPFYDVVLDEIVTGERFASGNLIVVEAPLEPLVIE